MLFSDRYRIYAIHGVNIVDSMMSVQEKYATRVVELAVESTRPKASTLTSALTAIAGATTEEQRRR